MNILTLFSRLLVMFCLASTVIAPVYAIAANENTINAVLGDISFVKRFGYAPQSRTDAELRIRTHLEYVGQILRSRNTKHLSADLQRKRAYLLDKLDEYRTAGLFPKNIAYTTHRPCFLDADGAICAVGYLIEQSAGRNLAERINAAHQYDYISTMTMPELHAWVRSSGLTVEECAMIQPTYGPPGFDPYFQTLSISPSVIYLNSTTVSISIEVRVKGVPAFSKIQTIPLGNFLHLEDGNEPVIRLLPDNFNGTTSTVTTSASIPLRFEGTLRFSISGNIKPKTYIARLYYYPPIGRVLYSSSTALTIIANTTSSISVPNDYQSRIFPNPAHETFTFQNGTEQARVRLVTALGEEVRSEKIVQAEEEHTFDLRGLVSGVYFVETRSSAGRRVQKVIKY